MTTIAYRNGVMCADTQAYLGPGEPKHARKSKVFRLKDGSLLGVSSSIVGAAVRLVPWVEEGCDHDNWPVVKDADKELKFEMMQVFRSGEVRYWNDAYTPTTIDVPFHAVGSGASYALGAMAAGCEATGAVRIACDFDPFSGGNIETWRLNNDA